MDKEILMNAVADIDFLLMITGFSLFLAIAAIIMMVGVRETCKDIINDFQVFIPKHNLVVKNLDNTQGILNELIDKHNLLGNNHEGLTMAHNNLIELHNKSVVTINESVRIIREINALMKENATSANNAFTDITDRLKKVERVLS